MKMRLFSLLLVTMLIGAAMTGCRTAGGGDALRQSVGATAAPEVTPGLTPEKARKIALEHAGLTEDQVVALHTGYEIEHGTPIYDVEFHHREWDYDYEIHADTGEILAFSKDD